MVKLSLFTKIILQFNEIIVLKLAVNEVVFRIFFPGKQVHM